MLQLFETERFLFDRAVPWDREALWAFHGRNFNRRPPSAPGDITGGIFACLAPLAKPNPIPTSIIRGPLQDARGELSPGELLAEVLRRFVNVFGATPLLASFKED